METLFSDKRGVVTTLYVPTKFTDFVPKEGNPEGKSIVKVGGIAIEDSLFISGNRGQWDLKDTRTRLPWGGMGLLVEPEAHAAFRAAWLEAMGWVINVGQFPVWVVGYRMREGAAETYKARGVSVALADGLQLGFSGARLGQSVFASGPPSVDKSTGEVKAKGAK